MTVFIALFFLALAQIALGQDVAPAVAAAAELPALAPDAFIERSFWDTLFNGDFLAKVTALAVAVQVVLWGMGEGLTRLSVVIDNKMIGKLGRALSEAAWVLGSVCGKFGYSTPKLVIEEKAQAIVDKEKQAGG